MIDITRETCISYIEDLKSYENESYEPTNNPEYDWQFSYIAFKCLACEFTDYYKMFAEQMPDTDLEIFNMDTTSELIELVEYFARNYYIFELEPDEEKTYAQKILIDEFNIERTVILKRKSDMEDVTERACNSYIEDLRNFAKGQYNHEYVEYSPKLAILAFKTIASDFHNGKEYEVYNDDLLTFKMNNLDELIKLVEDFKNSHIIYLLKPLEKVSFKPSNIITVEK